MRITCLAGGVGGARFVRGLLDHLAGAGLPPDGERPSVTVIGNTGDDITLHGLRVCPDLDTILYTLGGAVSESQGWGRQGETTRMAQELSALGAGPSWFTLGDLDMATHIARSHWLGQGMSLSQVTERLARRWGLPELGVTLLPATDTPIETHVVVDDPDGVGDSAGAAGEAAGGAPGGAPGGDGADRAPQRAMHFQQWWVQHHAALPARRFTVAGLDRAVAAPGVLDALRTADVILLPPSNPVVSIGIILGVPGIRDALRGSRAPVVGVSPIIGSAPVRGYADACLAPLGVEVSAAGVSGLYADFLDGWLVDTADQPAGPGSPFPARTTVRSRDLLMRGRAGAAALAGATLDLATELRTTTPGSESAAISVATVATPSTRNEPNR